MSEMSQIVPVAELERRMRPGAYSSGGFLGPVESLESVIERDRQVLTKLGISYERLADGLEKVLQSVLDKRKDLLEKNHREYSKREGETPIPNLYRPVPVPGFSLDNLPDAESGYTVEGHLQVFIAQYRGLQECPWKCEYENWGGFDFLILNQKSGEYVTGPGLIVHLIRKHRFFEGIESPYRVDPAKVVNVLQLIPETDSK